MPAKQESISLEKAIVKSIQAYLTKEGVWYKKTHGGPFQRAGLPDFICIVDGLFVGLEVKRPVYGQITALQHATLDRIERAGGIARVVTCVEEAEGVFREIPQYRARMIEKTI